MLSLAQITALYHVLSIAALPVIEPLLYKWKIIMRYSQDFIQRLAVHVHKWPLLIMSHLRDFFSILQVFLTAYFRFPLFYGNAQLVYSVTVNVGHVHKSPVTHWGPIFLEVELTRRVTPACVASQIAVITSIKYLVKKIYSLTHLTLFIPAERYDCLFSSNNPVCSVFEHMTKEYKRPSV